MSPVAELPVDEVARLQETLTRARAEENAGDEVNAERGFREVLDATRGSRTLVEWISLANLTGLYMRQGRESESLLLFRRLVDGSADFEPFRGVWARQALCMALANLEEWPRLADELPRFEAAIPGCPAPHLTIFTRAAQALRATIALQCGTIDDARALHAALLASLDETAAPNTCRFIHLIGADVELRARRLPEALEAARRARAYASSPVEAIASIVIEAECLVELEGPAAARELVRDARRAHIPPAGRQGPLAGPGRGCTMSRRDLREASVQSPSDARRVMRVLIWSSTLQADILALALHLDARPDTELLVAAKGLDAWRREPIARVRPFRARMVDASDAAAPAEATAFRADVVVCDNHFPKFPAAPRVCVLWHGLGWKARDANDIRVSSGHIARLTGIAPQEPNPRLLAQCYHEHDRAWRIGNWGYAPENCRVTGSCFSDLILDPPYTRADLASNYRIDVAGRRTLVLNLGWHFGRVLPGASPPPRSGRAALDEAIDDAIDEDVALVRSLFAHAARHGANVLVCLHDRWRYDAAYIEALHREAARHTHVELKHRDERPDNLADLVVADACVSNLSSFVTFSYHFGRPSIHLVPSPGARVQFLRATPRGVRPRPAEPETAWMRPPEDNGGLTVHDAAGALDAVDRALTEPGCCRERSRQWLANHVDAIDGHASRRLGDAIAELAGRPEPRDGPRTSALPAGVPG